MPTRLLIGSSEQGKNASARAAIVRSIACAQGDHLDSASAWLQGRRADTQHALAAHAEALAAEAAAVAVAAGGGPLADAATRAEVALAILAGLDERLQVRAQWLTVRA